MIVFHNILSYQHNISNIHILECCCCTYVRCCVAACELGTAQAAVKDRESNNNNTAEAL